MSINTNVYGTDWVNDLHSMAKSTNAPLYSYVIDGVIPPDTLPDASPCYCGMLSDNYLINAIVCRADKSFFPLYNNNSSVNAWFLMRNYADPAGSPENMNIQGYPSINRFAKWDLVTDLPYYYAEYSNHFIFNLKLNKLLFVPYVKCSSTGTYSADTSTYTLAAYEAAEHIAKPFINGVYMQVYYNQGTDEAPEWISAPASTDDYIFTTPIAELSEDVQNKSDKYVIAFSLISSTVGRGNIPIMGFGETPSRNLSDSGSIYNPIGLDPDTTHYIYDNDETPANIKYCRPYSESAIQDIWKQIAYYGVFFLGAGSGSWDNVALTSDRVFCGTIEADGITKGNYTRGADNADQQQYTWDDTSDSPYDPSKEVDPNRYNGAMNINIMSDIETVTNRYSLSSLSYSQLSGKLWEIMADIPPDTAPTEYALDVFLTTNPIDNIVSLKYFPLVDDPNYGSGVHVHLGSYDTNISAYKAKTVVEHQCGRIKIFPQFNDWRDYETEIMLYLPFCGTISIDPKIYMNRWLYVDYVIDIITGNCSAAVYVYADNGNKMIVEIANGNCSIDLPITGIEQVTLQGQMYNATEQMKQLRVNNDISELSLATSLMGAMSSGNVLGAASNLFNAATTLSNNITAENIAEYDIEHMKVPVKMIGTTGSVTGLCMELYPTIIYIRPTTAVGFDIAKYGHTVGFADCSPCTIGSKSGYAVFTNVDLSGFSATAAEKNAILTALQAGVILP